MPSFGSLLKKKRTRENPPEPQQQQQQQTANPTSPVTTSTPTKTTSGGSDHHHHHSLNPFHSHQSQQQQQQQQQPQISGAGSGSSATGGGHHHTLGGGQVQVPASNGGQPTPATTINQNQNQNQNQPQHQHQHQIQNQIQPHGSSSSYHTQSSSTTAVTATTNATTPNSSTSNGQNLPSINNLINPDDHDNYNNSHSNHTPPQNDGAAANIHANPDTNNLTNTAPFVAPPHTLGAANETSVNPSPGTDPSQLQKQQQAAHPIPPMPKPQSHSDKMDIDTTPTPQPQVLQQQQPPQQQPPQQQQQQQQHQQSHPAVRQPPQVQHQHTSSVARITKGKYSLNDFDILRTLGTGSFGRVHLVQSKHNQRFYAIKVLKKAQVVKMKQVEHTNDERRMLSDVKHPFLVTLWGTFQDWKNLYMVMDFVEGGELFSLLRKSGRFPNPVAKFYAAEVTLALEYMHSKNIIYRDLKPENLLLDRHGHLKITDFGFAKRVPDKTWTLCGTPDYLAPEVVSNKGYNKSVDWWSLGILIYEMLCGYTPFWDSGSPMRIYENILKGKIKYPAYIQPEAQDLLEKLITADLTKRLGNLYGGSSDVKNHAWFREVTWDRLARKDIDAPYTPPVKAGTGDSSQFDKYPEEQDKYGGPGGNDEYVHPTYARRIQRDDANHDARYGHLFVDF